MPLKPGELDSAANFVDPDCMARYIEDAMPEPADPEDSGRRGRREFFIALATGIIEYLKAHEQDGFKVEVTIQNTTYPGKLDIL